MYIEKPNEYIIKSYLEVQKKHNTKLKKNRCLTEIVPYLVYLFNNHSEIIIPHISIEYALTSTMSLAVTSHKKKEIEHKKA